MKQIVFKGGLVAVTLALTACGSGGGSSAEGEAGGGASTPANIALTATGAPKRADGYWAQKNIGGGGTVIGTQYLCVGDGSEEKAPVYNQIAMNINCSKYDIKRTDAGWDFEFICGNEYAMSESKGTVTGDFAKSYKVDMTVKEGSFSQNRIIEASNGGACPAGVAPGDLMDEAGKKVTNVLN